MQEVDALAVDRGDELRVRVERLLLRTPVEPRSPVLGELVPTAVDIEELADGRCAFEPGSDDPERLALYLGMLGADFEVVDSPELVTAVKGVIGRYQRAIGAL